MTAAPTPTGLPEALTDVCRAHPVELAYLFGSTARGTADRESDLDLAILAFPDLLAADRRDLRFRFMAAVADRLGLSVERVDVVVLQDVPVLLQHNVVRTGRLLFARTPTAHTSYERAVARRYVAERPSLDRETKQAIDRILSRAA